MCILFDIQETFSETGKVTVKDFQVKIAFSSVHVALMSYSRSSGPSKSHAHTIKTRV